ncbi:hypothetical protein J4219_08445 [Candidatus Woesearchaeota archaeon]|nr:hypothetical protein [Candidatus Woesearchaeota archaeon]
MSKGQMEIFGLVVIVILLAIGLLFAIVILTKTPTRDVARVKESLQAANFLNTMMGTTSQGCGKRAVRELLQDCAVAGVDNGRWIGASACEDGNTCELAQDMIQTMLNQTLGDWNKNYRFFVNGTRAVELIKVESGPCSGEREGSTRPEKVRPGLDIVLTLHICR